MLRLLAAFALLLHATTATASAVVLWPVDPVIAAGQQSTALWIENRGKEPVTMQIRSLEWRQQQGEDATAAQDRVVSSPPVAEVAPGARQLVRIIRRARADEGGERSYRLLIDELPRPADPAAGQATATLAVQMRYSIPLFTYGTAALGTPRLHARILAGGDRRYLEIGNDGSRHARLTDLRVGGGTHPPTIIPGLVGYVLAGAIRRIALPADAPLSDRITVAVDGHDEVLAVAI